ncbi:hypothetical protein FAVG1_04183 [Fusarium avenaceum]|nr:hypothetical protein FAVG1_04183 [Fusarium avenaceum]
MRYEDWDVLLFEQESGVPFREFNVACHVIQHEESMSPHLSALPTVTCFVPSLKAGTPFRISIHSWKPIVRQLVEDGEFSVFEFKLFIDGDLVASISKPNSVQEPIKLPYIIENGPHEQTLKFPLFQQELLSQRHWSPADNLGRLKLIISEGVSYPSPDNKHVEKLKSLVVFSFQHAPQEILERLKIAWPNPAMWQRQQTYITTPQANNSFDVDQIAMLQSPFTFQGHVAPEHENTYFGTTGFSASLNSQPEVLNAQMSSWTNIISPLTEDLSPHMSTPQVQVFKENSDQVPTWPVSPRLADRLFELDPLTQQTFMQQLYTPSNGSVPMPFVQTQAQKRAVHRSTELGRSPEDNPARLLFGVPAQASSQESFNSDTVKRVAKRHRPNTPAPAETLKGNQEHKEPDTQLDYRRFELLSMPGDII